MLGLEHLDTATTQNNIGVVLKNQGKYPEALEMYDKCLKTREKLLGRNNLDVAETYNKYDFSLFSLDLISDVVCSIGNVLQRMAKYEAALENLNKSLQIKIRVLGHMHPLAADTKSNIALVYENQAKYPEALQMHQEVLEVRLKTFGPDHLEVAKTKVSRFSTLL